MNFMISPPPTSSHYIQYNNQSRSLPKTTVKSRLTKFTFYSPQNSALILNFLNTLLLTACYWPLLLHVSFSSFHVLSCGNYVKMFFFFM